LLHVFLPPPPWCLFSPPSYPRLPPLLSFSHQAVPNIQLSNIQPQILSNPPTLPSNTILYTHPWIFTLPLKF
jgi:hypothetical protein